MSQQYKYCRCDRTSPPSHHHHKFKESSTTTKTKKKFASSKQKAPIIKSLSFTNDEGEYERMEKFFECFAQKDYKTAGKLIHHRDHALNLKAVKPVSSESDVEPSSRCSVPTFKEPIKLNAPNVQKQELGCCLHGNIKCQRGLKIESSALKNKKKIESNCFDDDKSGGYEATNNFLEMKSISSSDVAAALPKDLSNSSKYENLPQASRRLASLTDGDTSTKSAASPPTQSEKSLKEKDGTAQSKFHGHKEKSKDDKRYSKPTTSSEKKKERNKMKTSKQIADEELDKLLMEETQAVKPISQKPHVKKTTIAASNDNMLQRFYLGILTSKQAEQNGLHRSTFRIYHRLPSSVFDNCDTLTPEIPLFIVYRNAHGDYYHYQIINQKSLSIKGSSSINQISVEYGEPAPCFDSIGDLIKYYEIYQMIDPSNKGPEIFPWWNCDECYRNHVSRQRRQS